MQDAFIYDGLRTPVGRHAGGLAPVRADDLLAGVIAAVIARSPFKAEEFEDAIVGCTNQAGEDARNVARHAALLGGLPTSIGGLTVNRLCGSGLAAIVDAGRAARCGQGALFIAGGVESMSRAPFVTAKSESAYAREVRVFDSTIGARFPNPRIGKAFGEDTMPQTADNVGKDLAIGREASDRFAAASQQKYGKAKAAGFYDGEIAPVTIGGRKGAETIIAQDEHPRPNTTYEPAPSATRRGRSRWRASSRRQSPASSRASWGSARCPPRRRRWSAPASRSRRWTSSSSTRPSRRR
jgi:acetyl-CoA C-acetyltransferase